MDNSVSLMNGIQFNRKMRHLHEGMQGMNPTEKVVRNTSTAMDMYSRNRTTEQDIDAQYKASNDKYADLITNFDTVKNSLTSRIKQYVRSAPENDASIGKNIINKGGRNIFVTEPSGAKTSDAKLEGCYTDKASRAIQDEQNEGYVFSVNACAQRAIDKGQSVFGVQNVNDTGLAQCFIGSDMGSATQYGEAYQKERLWQTSTAGKNVTTLLLNMNGNLTLHNDVFLSPDKTKGVYVGNSNRDNVKKVGLDRIGMRVGNVPTNTQNPRWKDTFAVENDGKTISVQRTDKTTGWGQNLHLEGMYKDVTNVVWTSDTNDQADTYGCPSYFGTSDDFTSTEATYCSGYRLVMENDGNLVIMNKNRAIIWSSKTNNPGKIKVDEWLSGSYRGRDFINAGEVLQRGQWIASKNGANIAILEDDGNFTVYRSEYPCKTINGQTYGGNNSNAVYSIPPANISNLGSMSYNDMDNKVSYSYQNVRQSDYGLQHDKFILIGAYNSYEQDLSSFSATSIEQCEDAAAKVPECGGFVYNKKQQRCFLKGKNVWPRSQRVLDGDCIMKIKTPKVDVDESCPSDFLTVTSSEFELYPKPTGAMSRTMKCGLGKLVDETKGDYDRENEVLMNELDTIVNEINSLAQQRDSNLKTMPDLRDKIASRFAEYKQLKKEYKTYHNRKMDPTLSQYKRDSEMRRGMYDIDVSMLSLLGIGGILLAMRLMK